MILQFAKRIRLKSRTLTGKYDFTANKRLKVFVSSIKTKSHKNQIFDDLKTSREKRIKFFMIGNFVSLF